MNLSQASSRRSSGLRQLALCTLALATVLSSSALAAGQLYGKVSGYVFDPTGAPLAEVPMTISSSALQQPIERTSGDDGRFEFNLLPPGEDYVITVNVPGFTPIKQTGIKVLLGQTSPVDVHLSVLTETQAVATYEIVEKVNPIINPDSAQTGSVIGSEKAEATPTFHQVQGIPQQVAGVSASNTPSTRGGISRWGKFYLDGMDTTDITDGSITAPMNFDVVENFEVITGGLDAEYNSLGMIENVVTKSGGNNFTFDVNVTASPPWSSAKNILPANQTSAAGLNVNTTAALPNTSFYSPVFNIGGPIIKDKLWFYASGQMNFSDRETSLIQNLPGSTNEIRNQKTVTTLGRLKLTWQPTSNDRLSVAFNYDHNTIDNGDSSGFTTPEAELRTDRGGFFVIANYDHNFSDNLLFTLRAGTTYKDVNFDPQIGPSDIASHRDNTFSITQKNANAVAFGGSGTGNFQHEKKQRWQLDPTLSWKLKSHQMKAGFQFSYLTDINATGVYGFSKYFDRGGICDEADPSTFAFCNQRVDYYDTNNNPATGDNPFVTRASAQIYGAFIQDRWNIGRQLTLIPGFRMDVGRLFGDDGNLVTHNLVGYGPRLSFTYDLLGDRKSLVTGHYGRSNDVGDISIAQRGNPALTAVTKNWNTTTGSFPDCTPDNLLNCTLSGGANGRFLAETNTPPHVDEIALGFKQATTSGVVLGVDGTWRRYSNMWVDEEINRIWDPSGTRIIGGQNGIAQSILRGQTDEDAYRSYASVDLSAQGNTGNWDIYAAYTLSYNWGTVSNYFDGYKQNPRMDQWYNGWLPDDQRHSFKASITYKTPFFLDFGTRIRYTTGRPLWENFQNPGDNAQSFYRSPRGTGFAGSSSNGVQDFNDPSSWVELRAPSQLIVDLQGRYDIGSALKLPVKVELIVLVVNLLNDTSNNTYTDRWQATNNRFGLATSSRPGAFQAEGILRVRN